MSLLAELEGCGKHQWILPFYRREVAQGLGCQPVLRGVCSRVNAGSAARGAEPRWPGAEGDSGKPGRRLRVWDGPLGMHVAVLAALPESGHSSQRE